MKKIKNKLKLIGVSTKEEKKGTKERVKSARKKSNYKLKMKGEKKLSLVFCVSGILEETTWLVKQMH